MIEKAEFHLRVRWLGAPLFLVGVGIFLYEMATVTQSQDWFFLLLSIGCAMLGLTTFGVNHDTAVAIALQAKAKSEEVQLSSALKRELEEDLQRDRSGTMALVANEKTAVVVPFLAVLLQAIVLWRILG